MKTILKKIFLPGLLACTPFVFRAQNWQYLGAPYINQTAGSVTSLDFGDLEADVSGNAYVTYTEGTGAHIIKSAVYNGVSWTALPALATIASGSLGRTDLEVQGTSYYLSYAATISNKSYAFVYQYNGSNAWVRLGDSLLLGSTGASGYDLLIDQSGVPTLVGAVPSTTAGVDKKIMKYSGGAWNTVCTLNGSGSMALNENSAVYDSQNALYCIVSGGYVFKAGALSYYTAVHKVVGGTDSIAGDTLFTGYSIYSNGRVKVNSADVPFICAVNSTQSKTVARMLNNNTWTLWGDTSVKSVQMTSFDIAAGNKVVFCGTTTTYPFKRRLYYYDATGTYTMDTLNTSYSLAAVPDLVVPGGSSNVYQMEEEIKTGAIPDFSVMQHSAMAGIGEIGGKAEPLHMYPNPGSGLFCVEPVNAIAEGTIEVYTSSGQRIVAVVTGNKLDLSGYPKGLYVVRIVEGSRIRQGRLIVE